MHMLRLPRVLGGKTVGGRGEEELVCPRTDVHAVSDAGGLHARGDVDGIPPDVKADAHSADDAADDSARVDAKEAKAEAAYKKALSAYQEKRDSPSSADNWNDVTKAALDVHTAATALPDDKRDAAVKFATEYALSHTVSPEIDARFKDVDLRLGRLALGEKASSGTPAGKIIKAVDYELISGFPAEYDVAGDESIPESNVRAAADAVAGLKDGNPERAAQTRLIPFGRAVLRNNEGPPIMEIYDTSTGGSGETRRADASLTPPGVLDPHFSNRVTVLDVKTEKTINLAKTHEQMTEYACLDAMHGGPAGDGEVRHLINVATDLRTFNIYFYKFVGPDLVLERVQYMAVKYTPGDSNERAVLATIRRAFRCAFDWSTRRHYPTLQSINTILKGSKFEATGLSKTLSSPGARNGVFRVVARRKEKSAEDAEKEYHLAIKVGDKADIEHEVGALRTFGDKNFTVVGNGTCSFVHKDDTDKYGYVMNFCGRRLQRSDLTVDVIKQLVEQLFAIHEANWSHCDVHPRNIVIDDNGTARIIDFDHAKPKATQPYSGTVATASAHIAEAVSHGREVSVSLKDELESLFFSLVLIISGETVRNVDGDKWKARTVFWARYANAARYADEKLLESVNWDEDRRVSLVTRCFENALSLFLLTKTESAVDTHSKALSPIAKTSSEAKTSSDVEESSGAGTNLAAMYASPRKSRA